jgi:hypothetical protein
MKKTAAFLFRYPFLVLFLFLLVAYFPVFLPYFHIKNDLITQNLPVRYIIGESLYSGYFPWWNPYINFGIPMYGDMNTGFWNPFLWLIAGTSGYGIWVITLEEMAYILVGGWGIYLLCKELFRLTRNLPATREGNITPSNDLYNIRSTAIVAAMVYMTCGFVLGHLQHFCWITGAAFFPYVLLYIFRVRRLSSVKNIILGGWCIFLFVASTHPGLVIGALYFLLFLSVALYSLREDMLPAAGAVGYWKSILLLLLAGLLLSIIVIISNMDVLHHISRGTIVTLKQSLRDPTSLPCYLSLLFPLAVQKASAFFHSDISMRNTYVNLLIFASLIPFVGRMGKKVLLPFCGITIFFVLLSSGGLFKTFAYYSLPLTGYVRLNGEFNYFVVLMLILAGAAGLNQAMNHLKFAEKLQRVLFWLKWFFWIALTASPIIIFLTRQSILFCGPGATGDFKQTTKWIIDQLSFWDMVWIQSTIALITLYLIRRYRDNRRGLVVVVALHQALLCWCILPYTGLGMADKASRQSLISQMPKGIHAPEQKALIATTYLDSSHVRELGLLGAYSKKIGYVKKEAYPIVLTGTATLFKDSALMHFILRQSWLFLSKDTTVDSATSFDSSFVHIQEFGPGQIRAVIDNKGYNYITLLQNDYPYWKVKINGRAVSHFTGFKTFITLPLSQGRQELSFSFHPAPIKTALFIQLSIVLLSLLLLCSRKIRDRLLVPLPVKKP